MKRVKFLTHAPLLAHFSKSARDFSVEEIPLYEPSGSGEHLYLKIRKKGLSTPELLEILSQYLGVKIRDIGYAGLKDKEGMTIQWISLPGSYEAKLNQLTHPHIKILAVSRHANKLRIGHLKGNRFFVRLKKVLPTDALKLTQALEHLKRDGLPNYFGYQRFGRDGDNAQAGKEILEGIRRERNLKVRELLVNAYQSALFNAWLSRRVELSRLIESFQPAELTTLTGLSREELKNLKRQEHFFKILAGEVMHHYPYGKMFLADDPATEAARFALKQIVPTGLLFGRDVLKATSTAALYESPINLDVNFKGARRFAWIWPDEIESRYIEEEAHFELRFALPKGSYATIFIEELLQRDLGFGSEEDR
ncbi:MAG: tRNA pseudouridine(13) synthase TruD [Campylobacterales bacterium]